MRDLELKVINRMLFWCNLRSMQIVNLMFIGPCIILIDE